MKLKKDDITALIGTIIIHLTLFLILYLSILRTTVPNEDSGIFVNFGDISASIGALEPQYSENTQRREVPPPPTRRPAPTANNEIITQNKEETVSLPEKKEEEPKKEEVTDDRAQRERAEAERIQREENERKQREEEQRRQQEAISNRVSNAFGMGSSPDNDQGNATTGTGNQGSPFGNTDTGANEGTGGFGTFNLNGRSIGRGGLPRPAYNSQEEGRIVINITVDPNGNVILAEIGRGTDISNSSMRNSAIDAARRAKFNRIQGTNNQSGTITYRYKLL